MLNRRHLRIKVLHALYAFFQTEEKNIPKAKRQLMHSVDKFYEMYIHLLSIMQQLHVYRVERVRLRKARIMATEEDKNASTRFIDNKILLELVDNEQLDEQIQKFGIVWDDDRLDLIRDLNNRLLRNEDYKEYITKSEGEIEEDMRVVVQVFKKCVANNDLVHHYLDEMSIFWADDLDLACGMVIKTLKGFKGAERGKGDLLGLFKEEKEEREFIEKLFSETISQDEENEKLIDVNTKNWDLDRIAFMDIILMKMALAEAKTFKFIPVKVTLNEYIELSKYYSTPKSNTFINGILDNLFAEMKSNGQIKKMGRGLLES